MGIGDEVGEWVGKGADDWEVDTWEMRWDCVAAGGGAICGVL
jgi:hypothetical protein